MTTGGLDPDPPDPGARVDVEAIRARADAATPGPLVVEKQTYERSSVHYWIRTRDPLPRTDCAGPDVPRSIAWMTGSLGEASARPPSEYRDDPQIKADAGFFAHARADVPALCNALERERRVSSAWRALADARLSAGEESWAPLAYHVAAEGKALADLRALGIDPEAP